MPSWHTGDAGRDSDGAAAVKIGVPRELKDSECRVALTPAGAKELVLAGHRVFVERGAGSGSAMADEEYRAAGATLLDARPTYGPRATCC